MKLELKPQTFMIRNEDTLVAPFTICPKEVIQKGWQDKVGKPIDFCGETKTVNSVKITDEYIIVGLV
jgi:hypothetical protein